MADAAAKSKENPDGEAEAPLLRQKRMKKREKNEVFFFFASRLVPLFRSTVFAPKMSEPFEWPAFYAYPPYFTYVILHACCTQGWRGHSREGVESELLRCDLMANIFFIKTQLAQPQPQPLLSPHPPPPLFNSLQPIKETRSKQSALWRDLILAYCKHEKVRERKSGGERKKISTPLARSASFSFHFHNGKKTRIQIFVLSTTDDGPLFANKEINRKSVDVRRQKKQS